MSKILCFALQTFHYALDFMVVRVWFQFLMFIALRLFPDFNEITSVRDGFLSLVAVTLVVQTLKFFTKKLSKDECPKEKIVFGE